MAGQTGAAPIDYQSPLGGGLLTDLLGRRTTQGQNTSTLNANMLSQLLQGQTTGSTGQTTSGTTTTSANIDPLQAVFASGMAGLTPESMAALISSIFQEGAQQVPSLVGAYANATGSRASRNSPLQLALGDLNRQLSTQAVQAMLNYNQQGQQNAGNAAAQIAANTRSTANTGTQQGTTQQANTQQTNQTQTGATQQQQQTRTAAGINPSSAGLLAGGGTLLNFLGKTPWGKQLLGLGGGAAAATPTIGTPAPMAGITGAVGSPAPSFGALSSPSPSAGFLPGAAPAGGIAQGIGAPVSGPSSVFGGAAPAVSIPSASMPAPAIPNFGGITDAVGAAAPIWGGGAGIGATDPLSGAVDYFGTGNFWGGNAADVFNIGSASSLGSNLPSVDWGIDYGGMTGGILGQGGTDFAAQFAAEDAAAAAGGGGFGDFFGGVGDFLGSAWDTLSGWFANGGFINPPLGDPSAPVAAKINAYRPGGYANGGLTGRVNSSLDAPGGNPSQFVPGGVARSTFTDLDLGMIVPGIVGFADGGQIATGGNVRGRPQMGAPIRRQQSQAINYEGYAPSAGVSGGGSSVPTSTTVANVAAAVPAAQAGGGQQAFVSAPGAPQQQAQAVYIDPAVQMMEQLRAQQEQQARITLAQQSQMGVNQMGGSGGVGEGASPGQNEADNAAAGIGPSGAAAAPPGTGQAVNMGLSMVGMPAPPMSINLALALLQAIVAQQHSAPVGTSGGVGNNAVSAGLDATGAVASPVGQGNPTGIDIGPVGSGIGIGDGTDGGVGTSSDAGSGDGSVGSGAGSSGTSGTGDSPGEGWKNGGRVRSYMTGGLVRGPGTGTSDSIRVPGREAGAKAVAYSDEEFVIPADVVRQLGANTFQSIIDAFHTPA